MHTTVVHGDDSFDVIDYLQVRLHGPHGEHGGPVATPRVVARWEERSIDMELLNPGSTADLLFTNCAPAGALCGDAVECQRRVSLMRRSIYEAYGGPIWEKNRVLDGKFDNEISSIIRTQWSIK